MAKLRWLLSILIIALFSTAVSADTLHLVQGPVDKVWVNATGTDTSVIKVQLLNETDSPVSGILIDFNVTTPNLGSINPSNITDGSGFAQVVFTSGTKSGPATITSVVHDDPNVNLTLIQSVDHDVPRKINVFYNNTVSVGKNTTILVQFLDVYNNPVDNLREKSENRSPEQVRFQMTSPSGTGYFVGEWENISYNGTEVINDTIGLPVNSTGYIKLNLKMDTAPEPVQTIVLVDPLPPDVLGRILFIQGIADGVPWVIDQQINPTVLYQPADENSTFSLAYTLYDEYGNRLGSKVIHVTSDAGDDFNLTTASNGVGVTTYGPTETPQVINFYAYPLENTTIGRAATIEFYDDSPTYMGITAIPELIPSLDVGSNINSTVKVKITDIKGKPVAGESVDFEILNVQVQSGNQTTGPYLSDPNSVTDINGFAVTHLIPGTFASVGEEGYNGTSSANCTVRATWGGVQKDTNVTWKNFPFLSIYTSVTSSNITVGQQIDVTIQVRGEGLPVVWRDPVDIIMTTSRSASMLKENPDRMVFAYEAENLLVDKLMSSLPLYGTDHVGLLTEGGNPNGTANVLYTQPGWSSGDAGIDQNSADDINYTVDHYPGNGTQPYNDMVTWEQLPTNDLTLLKSKINLTTPCSSTNKNANQNELPVRRALYESILQLKNISSTNNKAVILLVDSEITDYGDVLAGGNPDWKWKNMGGCTNRFYPFTGPAGPDTPDTWHPWDNKDKLIDPNQNLAIFAKNSGVKVYIVYAADQLNNCDEANLQAIADYTGGNFNNTHGDASQLPQIYDWIATRIMNEAGVQTQMSVDMGTLEVNGEWVTYDPNDPANTSIFDYIYEPGISTQIKNYYKNSTEIDAPYTMNQTDDFYDDHILHYDIGTIVVDQIWEATYRLQSLVNGTVKVPGPNTTLITNSSGLTINYELPSDWVTNLPDTHVQEPTYELTINEFTVDPESINVAFVSWQLNYTGPYPGTNVVANLYYKDSEGAWQYVASRNGLTGQVNFNTRTFPEGTIEFKLLAMAVRAPNRTAYTSTQIQHPENPEGSGYIILK
jgi:hypothetical protein